MTSYGSAAFKSGNIFHVEKLSKREKTGDQGLGGHLSTTNAVN